MRRNQDIKRYITCKRWKEEAALLHGDHQDPKDQQDNLEDQHEQDQVHHQQEGLEHHQLGQDALDEGEEGQHHQQLQHQHQQDHPEGEGGDKAVITACRNRMPGSIAQASSGGISPGLDHIVHSVTCNKIEEAKEHKEGDAETNKEDGDQQLPEEDHSPAEEGGHHHQLHHHPHHQDQPAGGGDKAVTPACLIRMPDSIVQASPGGITPGQGHIVPLLTSITIEDRDQEDKDQQEVPEEDQRGVKSKGIGVLRKE